MKFQSVTEMQPLASSNSWQLPLGERRRNSRNLLMSSLYLFWKCKPVVTGGCLLVLYFSSPFHPQCIGSKNQSYKYMNLTKQFLIGTFSCKSTYPLYIKIELIGNEGLLIYLLRNCFLMARLQVVYLSHSKHYI